MKKILLTRGMLTLVDDRDYEELSLRKWYALSANGPFYAASRNGNSKLLMHRVIMVADPRIFIDHKDGNSLNNQRYNLRVCTVAENGMNRGRQNNNKSGYKGVHWCNKDNRWRSAISHNGKLSFLGNFTCLIKAARAYDEAAKKYHGEFANLNFKTGSK